MISSTSKLPIVSHETHLLRPCVLCKHFDKSELCKKYKKQTTEVRERYVMGIPFTRMPATEARVTPTFCGIPGHGFDPIDYTIESFSSLGGNKV